MPLTAGARLGPYEIIGAIGAGGMGEVYRALDTRLGRTVAIKVLSTEMSSRPDVRDRFEREAQAISKLNHPFICTLYDVGHAPNPDAGAASSDEIHFLVMEHLEGETLLHRLERGPLPLKEALRIAIEIGEGLDTAHKQGIVHRDLKPGNVMLTTTGAAHQRAPQAKLLDFGLAKVGLSADGAAVPVTVTAATGVSGLTAAGSVLGTLHYMSPEQLEGKEADARSDIFGFGTLMYEMFTGRKAFQGKSQVSLMAAILEHDPPPVSSILPIVPSALDRIVGVCLAKDPLERWQTVSDVVKLLKWASTDVEKPVARAERKVLPRRERVTWASALGLSLVVAAGFAVIQLLRTPPAAQVVRFQVPPPEGAIFPGANFTPRMAISPDGQYLAFTANLRNGKPEQLWIRRLDSLEARPLPNTEGPGNAVEPTQQPFWSPDCRYIGFLSDFKLKKVDILSGSVQTLSTIPGNNFGGTWNSDGTILFGTVSTKGIQGISADGGTISQVTTTDASRQETAHLWPRFLPDGRHYLYFATTMSGESAIYVSSIDSDDRKLLFNSRHMADFAPPDHLLFVREGALMVQQFDVRALELRGQPIQIAENVQNANNGRAGFTVSKTGVLIFRPGQAAAGADSQLVWFDRTGKLLGTVGAVSSYRGVELSPDDLRAVVHREGSQGTGDLFVLDLERGSESRFTFDPAQHNVSPVWMPDGRRIVFGKNRSNSCGIYEKDSSGVGDERLLHEIKNSGFAGAFVAPRSPFADGQGVLFTLRDLKSNSDLWVLRFAREPHAVPYIQSPFNEEQAEISPDGRWVAYATIAGGNSGEVWVQDFPSVTTKFQVSTAGGTQPRWRRDGRELFYLTRAGGSSGPGTLMAVDVESINGALRFGIPHTLFGSGTLMGGPDLHVPPVVNYSVTRDGRRFLMARQFTAQDVNPGEVPLTVVLNWPAAVELR